MLREAWGVRRLTGHIFKQCLHKLFRTEGAQVFQSFPDADKTNRQASAFGQGKQDTAFGGAVELGECQPGHAGGITELFCLVDGILAGACIERCFFFRACTLEIGRAHV